MVERVYVKEKEEVPANPVALAFFWVCNLTNCIKHHLDHFLTWLCFGHHVSTPWLLSFVLAVALICLVIYWTIQILGFIVSFVKGWWDGVMARVEQKEREQEDLRNGIVTVESTPQVCVDNTPAIEQKPTLDIPAPSFLNVNPLDALPESILSKMTYEEKNEFCKNSFCLNMKEWQIANGLPDVA